MESGLNPRGKHRGLGQDSQAEWDPKCTTRLSPRGGPNTSNCRLLQISKSDYNFKFFQFGFYLRYARFKRIEQGFLFAAQF
uniref:Uncharacterized protein n=1 Tax=Oryza glumipatula TaxID=40148 RepID=A0A0E0BGV2_9ORYZ